MPCIIRKVIHNVQDFYLILEMDSYASLCDKNTQHIKYMNHNLCVMNGAQDCFATSYWKADGTVLALPSLPPSLPTQQQQQQHNIPAWHWGHLRLGLSRALEKRGKTNNTCNTRTPP